MENRQPITIYLHLAGGLIRSFQQADHVRIAAIFDDLDGRIFTRPTLIIESKEEVAAFPGHALAGICIDTQVLPDSFQLRESSSRTVVTQISSQEFQLKRHQELPILEGIRSNILSEIFFSSGEPLYLEISEIGGLGIDQRAEMHHLFANPSLACRRLNGGISLWNTSHMVAWTHYPKLISPENTWTAERLNNSD